MPRKRLLVLSSTYPRWPGDPEPGFVHELARRLTDDFEVAVLCPHAPGAATQEIMDGVSVHRYRYAPACLETLVNDGGIVGNLRRQPWKWLLVPVFLTAQLLSTWRLRKRWNADIVHAHWLFPQGLIAALLNFFGRRTPYLVTSHGVDLYALRAKPFQALKRWVAGHASAVTVVSPSMLDELARIGVEVASVAVQPMGVDLKERFTPSTAVGRSADEILFVGRLVEKKGLRHLIEAMPAILKNHPDAYLSIAGFGPEEALSRALVKRLGLQGKVRFLGGIPQAELPELYRRAAVFVAPFVQAESGDQEGLGLVVIEAAGCGCPVVVSDLPTVRGALDAAWVRWVPAQCALAISEAVCAVLAAPMPDAFKDSQRESMCLRFDWSSVAERYAQTLSRIIDQARSPE